MKTYNISECFAVCIANSDFTGLSDNDQLSLDIWADNLINNDHFVLSDNPLFWGKCEITGLHGDLVSVNAFTDKEYLTNHLK